MPRRHFAEGYKGVLSFIRNWVEDHYGTYMSRYESHLHMNDKVKVRDLSLNGKELEELFLSLGDGSFKMQMNQDPEITWQTVKAVPGANSGDPKKRTGLIAGTCACIQCDRRSLSYVF